MNLETVDGASALAEFSAAFVTRHVAANPSLSLTLPTGTTPLGLYRRLRHEQAANRFSLDAATVFMLDEYLDLPHYPRASFVAYLREHLGDLVFNDHTTVHEMTPPKHPSLATHYDAALDAAGGIDLAILGVGRNGHVAFNEPGSSPAARTHVVTLAADTLDANFAPSARADRPSIALTIGLADLRRARTLLLIVTGADKHDVASALLAGEVDPALPATHLLEHEDLTVVLDARLVR